MGSRSRQTAFQGRLIGAKIRARSARELAAKAIREADRAEAEAWSIRMEGYGGPGPPVWKAWGGPAHPPPTSAKCLKGGLGGLGVKCTRSTTRATLPLKNLRRPRDTPLWKLEPSLKCRPCRKGRHAPPVHMIKL